MPSDPAIDYSFGVQSVSSDERRARIRLAHALSEVRWENLSFGIACLHFGTRPHEA